MANNEYIYGLARLQYSNIMNAIKNIYNAELVTTNTDVGKSVKNNKRIIKRGLIAYKEDEIFNYLDAFKSNPYAFEVLSVEYSVRRKEYIIVFRVPTSAKYHKHRTPKNYRKVCLYESDITKMFETEINYQKYKRKQELLSKLSSIEKEKNDIMAELETLK